MNNEDIKNKIELLENQLKEYEKEIDLVQKRNERNIRNIEHFKSLLLKNKNYDPNDSDTNSILDQYFVPIQSDIKWLKSRITAIQNDMHATYHILKNHINQLDDENKIHLKTLNQVDISELKQILVNIYQLLKTMHGSDISRPDQPYQNKEIITFKDLPRSFTSSINSISTKISTPNLAKNVNVSYPQPSSVAKHEEGNPTVKNDENLLEDCNKMGNEIDNSNLTQNNPADEKTQKKKSFFNFI